MLPNTPKKNFLAEKETISSKSLAVWFSETTNSEGCDPPGEAEPTVLNHHEENDLWELILTNKWMGLPVPILEGLPGACQVPGQN